MDGTASADGTMIHLVTGGIGLAVAGLILWLIRRDKLHVDHGLGWVIVAAGFAFLGFSPGVIDFIAHRLGIAYPPVLGLSVAIAILVVKTLLMDIERSRIDVRNRRLTQRVAMLEAELEKLRLQREAAEAQAREN
jgi:hypothetical protein